MLIKTTALIVAAVVLGPLCGASAEENPGRHAAIEKCMAQARQAWPHVGMRGTQRHRAAAFRRCMERAGF